MRFRTAERACAHGREELPPLRLLLLPGGDRGVAACAGCAPVRARARAAAHPARRVGLMLPHAASRSF